jgi:hypothetical protein
VSLLWSALRITLRIDIRQFDFVTL